MGIYVEQPGILTSVQDEGRFGYMQYGVSVAGPMDRRSFHLANLLAGNDMGEAALEVTYMGPQLRFDEDNVIAVTGGDLQPAVNGTAIPTYKAVAVHAGDILSFGFVTGNGCRAYIAFHGGLDVPVVMGSRSTLMKNSIGGYEGRKLETGDSIGFRAPAAELPNMAARALQQPDWRGEQITLRVIPGPQDDGFTDEEFRKFFWYGATITDKYDRMGCRLEREIPVKHIGDGNIISDGIMNGSIQVPPDGQPIIMLADSQSVGGYPKIGTVYSGDLPLLAQATPGTKVQFVNISIGTAQLLYKRELEELGKLDEFLNN